MQQNAGKSFKGKEYVLYAALVHRGSLHGGHYKAVCFNHYIEKWIIYDDRYVDPIRDKNHLLRQLAGAYALFYRLKDSR